MTDDELIDLHLRVIAGDPAALLAFEAAMRPLVRGMLRNKGISDDDADDVWNDAFLAGIDRASGIEPLGIGLQRYVLAAAHHGGVDVIRRAIARPQASIDAAEGIESASAPTGDPIKTQHVQDCLESARPGYAEVMEMTARGLTAGEIAIIIGKSEGSVAKLRSRARAWFADCLKGIMP